MNNNNTTDNLTRKCSVCKIDRSINDYISKAGRTNLKSCQSCRDLKKGPKLILIIFPVFLFLIKASYFLFLLVDTLNPIKSYCFFEYDIFIY